MKKITLVLIVLMTCMANSIFAAGASKEEIINIPKTGILKIPVELGDKELVAYRDDAVMVTVAKKTTISKQGYFCMKVFVMPTDVIKKNEKWMKFVNRECSSWLFEGARISASPIEVDSITYRVAVNETEGTCKVYGYTMIGHNNGKQQILFKSIESETNRFNVPFVDLSRAELFDAAYRKVVQYHREH